MEKQSFGPLIGLAGRAVGFTATKVAPKILGAGWKMGRFAVKHPGMALTGAFLPSSMSGYMESARGQTLASLPRKLPSYGAKFANARGDSMPNDREHPSIFYKLDGFEKMAEESVAARRLVKKAFFGMGKLFGSSTTSEMKKEIYKKVIDLVSNGKSVDEAVNIGKSMTAAAQKMRPPKSFWQESAQYARDLPTAAKIAIPAIPAALFAERTIHKALENKKMNDSYRDMLKIHTDLQKESPQTTKQYFDYIKTYSPTVAKNPHAAGALVKRFVHSGGMLMDNSVIESLLKIEKEKSNQSSNKGILATIGAII